MKLRYLTPRQKAIGKLEAIRQSINDNFSNINPYSLSYKNWGDYGLAIGRISRRIAVLSKEN